jgi:glycosyltransferase involved in cell wall biosynthesis
MRILQLMMDCPWPPQSGGDIRNVHIVQSAAQLGAAHAISLGPADPGLPPANISTSQAPGFGERNPWHYHDPVIRTKLRLPAEALAHIAAEADRFRPDAAIVEGVILAEAIPVFQAAGIPVVLDMHNIESDVFRMIRRSKGPFRRLSDATRGERRWRSLHEFDTATSLMAEETWVTSEVDRRRLLELGGADAAVIPNPIPNEAFFDIPLEPARYGAPQALFLGHLSYRPNIAAARELATHIWPAVTRAAPAARLTIAGRTPVPAVCNLEKPDTIRIIADPSDPGDLVAEHGYTLMPIRQGGGTRIKVLEAMAAGLVIIATAKAVEGLPIEDGVHYLRAERTRDFANALARLHADPARALALAENARAFVRERYNTRTLGDMIAARLRALERG